MGRGRAQRLTLVVGVVFSVALGVFFYFRTDLNTALATFAGLIGTTITLQVESLFRERRDEEEATREQRLVRRIESLPWMPEWLDQALGAVDVIEHDYGATMAADLARKAFDDALAQLADLRRGHYNTPDDDDSPRSPVHALTRRLSRSLLTTSAGTDLDWWLRDSSNRSTYWKLNEQALHRGVAVERIFIYRDWSDELDALARAQHDAGIRVLRVAQDLLPVALRINITLWDDACGFELQGNSAGEVIGQHFTFAAQDLASMLDRFKLIESCAQPWPPTPSP